MPIAKNVVAGFLRRSSRQQRFEESRSLSLTWGLINFFFCKTTSMIASTKVSLDLSLPLGGFSIDCSSIFLLHFRIRHLIRGNYHQWPSLSVSSKTKYRRNKMLNVTKISRVSITSFFGTSNWDFSIKISVGRLLNFGEICIVSSS